MNIKLRTTSDVGALIREQRRTKGLSQAELAAKVGVSRLWINQIENGKAGAGIGLVLRVLAVLGIQLSGETSAPNENAQTSPPILVPDINAIVEAAKRENER